MDATDLDKIVDKLMVFRGKLPDTYSGYVHECTQEMINEIDRLIEFIDLYSKCGVIG